MYVPGLSIVEGLVVDLNPLTHSRQPIEKLLALTLRSAFLTLLLLKFLARAISLVLLPYEEHVEDFLGVFSHFELNILLYHFLRILKPPLLHHFLQLLRDHQLAPLLPLVSFCFAPIQSLLTTATTCFMWVAYFSVRCKSSGRVTRLYDHVLYGLLDIIMKMGQIGHFVSFWRCEFVVDSGLQLPQLLLLRIRQQLVRFFECFIKIDVVVPALILLVSPLTARCAVTIEHEALETVQSISWAVFFGILFLFHTLVVVF